MVSAIGSSAFPGQAGAGKPTAGLHAQLERYRKELSDCVNCDSANTRAGRENIQSISNKISEVKARIEEVAAAKSNNQPARIDVKPPVETSAKGDASAAGVQSSSAGTAGSSSGSATATLGSRLDVFA